MKERDTPERIVDRLLADLQAQEPLRWRGAALALLADGPLLTSEALRQAVDGEISAEQFASARTALLDFLRDVVQREGSGTAGGGLALGDATTVYAFSSEAKGLVLATDAPFFPAVNLQFLAFLDRVSFAAVRVCAERSCARFFIKTHRRAYCSVTCQQRDYKRDMRQREREQAERDRERAERVSLRRRQERRQSSDRKGSPS